MNKRIKRIVMALALLLLALPTSVASSEEGWKQQNPSTRIVDGKQNPTNGHYYQLVETEESGMNWFEARDTAATMIYNGIPGQLATVTSPQEEEFIVNNFPEIYPEYVWLGASDEVSEGNWQWITGEAWNYTDWAVNEPNGGTYENCLDYGDYSAQWNDESCYRKLNFYLVEFSGFSTISIDIKPESDQNSINCTAANVNIPVAILTTENFDATRVDHTTVTFEGASESHVNKKTGGPRRHEEDVDKDGDTDLVFHFIFGDTDLNCGSTKGSLTGETYDGLHITGTDTIRMTPQNYYYYTALLYTADTVKIISTLGLLSAGFVLGLSLVFGLPLQQKKKPDQ